MNKIFRVIASPSFILAIMCPLLISGCADSRRAVPPELTEKAQVVGIPGVRSFVESVDPLMEKSILEALKNEDPSYFPAKPDGTKEYATLAISGGADNGAYGAGLLKGWSEQGSRPVFKAVTGVSTGALIAPFAFLGSEYDKNIEHIYKNISTKNIAKRKSLISGLFGNSLASSEPLAQLILDNSSDDIVKAIAREHTRGRRLFIGTVNLDAARLVVWDLGAIAVLASQGDQKALKLFRDVLLASASIPVTFPPVFIEVEAGGKQYKEMHVDGGTLTQVFYMYGMAHNIRQAAYQLGIDPKRVKASLYVIRNGRVAPRWKEIRNHVGAIAERAIDSMTGAQAIGDVYRLYAISKAKGNGFHLAHIPDDYVPDKKEFFDQQEMRRLFEAGYREALAGRAWHDCPPGWECAVERKE